MKKAYVAVLILMVVSLLFLPVLAEAGGKHGGGWRGGGHGSGYHGWQGRGGGHGDWHHGWHGRGGDPGWYGLLGFGAGVLAGALLASPPVYAAPTCYQDIPGHWETRWDRYRQTYIQVYVPPSRVAYPCP